MTASEGAPRRGVEFFSARRIGDEDRAGSTAPDSEVSSDDLVVSYPSKADEPIYAQGGRLIFAHQKNTAFAFRGSDLHMGVFEFEPNIVLPLHSHSVDCLYYVERGSALMGNRVIGAGEGFLTRAHQPYSFRIGPEGLRLIEFTLGPKPEIAFHEPNADAWLDRLQRALVEPS